MFRRTGHTILAVIGVTAALSAGCQPGPQEADAAADRACEHWQRHTNQIFSPEIAVGERQHLVDQFRDLAGGSDTRGFSKAAERIAADFETGVRRQRDFDQAVDRISEACSVSPPDYPAREAD